MTSLTTVLIFAALVVLLGYALVDAWRRVLQQSAPLPLTGMLRLEGLAPAEAQEALGAQAFAEAARRCALCGAEPECQARVAAGEPAPSDCPNAALFDALRQSRA